MKRLMFRTAIATLLVIGAACGTSDDSLERIDRAGNQPRGRGASQKAAGVVCALTVERRRPRGTECPRTNAQGARARADGRSMGVPPRKQSPTLAAGGGGAGEGREKGVQVTEREKGRQERRSFDNYGCMMKEMS